MERLLGYLSIGNNGFFNHLRLILGIRCDIALLVGCRHLEDCDAALGGAGSYKAIRRKLAFAAKRLETCEEACERILELAKPYHEELKTHINQAKQNRERVEHIKRKLRSYSAAFK